MARRVCYVCVCVCVCVGVCRGCLVGTPSGALIYNMKHYRTARFDGLYCSRGFTKIFGGRVCHHSARDFFRGGRREYYPPPLAAPQKIRPFFWATRHLPLTQLVDARCISLPQKDDIMEGRESPLSCYFVDHAAPQKLNTDNPNLRGELHATRTVCALHSSTHLIRETCYEYTRPKFTQYMLDDESTQTKTLCAFCGETARAAHTITVRTHRPRPGGAGAAATACASLAVKRPTRWCDLRCPAHPVPPGRGARRGRPPHPLREGRSPAEQEPLLYRRAENEEASEPSARRLRSTGQLRRNLLSAGGEDRSNSVGARC